MRTVNFEPDLDELSPIQSNNRSAKFMRTYRTVTSLRYISFKDVWLFESNIPENVENLKFVVCKFRNPTDFVSFLNRCKQLKTVTIRDIEYVPTERKYDLKIYFEKFQRQVSVDIKKPDCELLDCFGNILHIRVREWDFYDQVSEVSGNFFLTIGIYRKWPKLTFRSLGLL
jgi:hypothetical protein